MKFAITGATGLLGHNVTRELLHQGHQVRAALRPSSNDSVFEGLEIELERGDLADSALIEDLLDGTDGLFHCAAFIWLGKTRLAESRHANVELTRRLAQACREQGKKMVHVSTVDALAASRKKTLCTEKDTEPPKAKSSYVISKREAEKVVLQECEAGLQACIVNPGFLIGPWDWKPSSGEMILAISRQFVPFSPAVVFPLLMFATWRVE